MFWIRRLVVLGLPLLLVVALAVWWAGSGGDAEAGPDVTTTEPAPDPSPTSGAEPGVADCAPEAIALAVAPGAEAFPAGVDPTFEVTVTNSGTEPCLVDVGDAHREVVITSGDDRVWSSLDCAPADAPARTLLLVGGQSDATQLGWARLRSAPGCGGGLPEPGDGTYSVTVAVAGATSSPAVFGLG
ncbi:hypothetical protein [Cellulomonas phragmiteti]|uniref:DUF4232 domain-containing protein n=1 Tax=Cellulomonas phragmiteti TaxID=478780 RepID=A0ABQ4DNA8_9CELL|nr:hypothetical protein [Cellulomonas phragmiteti]GIG40842.1 hypothetical protein Cph01nite_26040 [Cellulomonas phragmiteti]